MKRGVMDNLLPGGRARAVVLVSLLGTAVAAHGQVPAGDTLRTDSIGTYRAAEVVVDAQSILPRVSRGTQPLAVISRDEIEALNAVDISDAIGFAPGVFVKQYGGLGGLRTLSLRGTSAQQVVLLVDGVRYRTTADGAFDLSNIPAAAVERVEVVRGGNAALYGANALGGVINLVTRSSAGRAVRAAAGGVVGSFGERRFTFDAGGTLDADTWEIGLNSTTARGDYPFLFDEYGRTGELRRENADFTNLFGRAAWSHSYEQGGKLSLTLQGFQSERGTPGAVVQGNREQLRARLGESDLFMVVRGSVPVAGWQLSASASGRRNILRYRDPDARLAGPEGLDNRYDGEDASLALHARTTVGSVGLIDIAGEFSYAGLEGDNLDPSAGTSVQRLQWSGAVTTSWFLEQGLFGWETGVDVGMRADLLSDAGGALSPSVGVNLRLGHMPLRARLHGGLSYRAPTFTEQYYLNYGNRDLRPERGASLNAGLTFEATERLVLEANIFAIHMTDQIVAIPRSPVSWSAANIAAVLSRGVEGALSGTFLGDHLAARLSYTLMRVEDGTRGMTYGKLLVYSPQEILNGMAEVRAGWLAAGVNWQYVSHRFTLPANDPASALPHYMALGAGVSTGWKYGGLAFTARVECSNLLNADYQVVRNYPMPGRMLRMEVLVKFGGEAE